MDPVESIPEATATGEIAEIYSDIRKTLGTSVVNLIWRNLATIPGALQWAWPTVRPLYFGPAAGHAEAVRKTLKLPNVPNLSAELLAATGIDGNARKQIRSVLDSYHHTNALALVILSALLEYYEPSEIEANHRTEAAPMPARTELPPLPSMASLPPETQRLIEELNEFGEDGAPYLIASMYRHLAYWPSYLTVVRTRLAPLQANGTLTKLTRSARALGRAHGKALSHQLEPAHPPETMREALASCRLFVEHSIARMTGICTIIRNFTPD